MPCYSEALDIVAETVWAACQAELPPNCTSSVWLLDDGCDAAKQAWVEGMAHEKIRYVTGRKRSRGEAVALTACLERRAQAVLKCSHLQAK